MSRRVRSILAISLLAWSSAASAAPVVTDIQLTLGIQGLASPTVTFTGVSVDVTSTTVTVSSAVLTNLGIVIPIVSATTAVQQISIDTVGLQTGTFSLGGVANQLPGEICPVGGPAVGEACNEGGGIGGALGLTGTVNVSVIPGIVVIPVNLDDSLAGQGGSTNTPFTFDAAGWSTRTGRVNLGTTSVTTAGFGTPNFLELVTPTYVSALGNLLPILLYLSIPNVGLTVPEPSALILIGTGVAGLLWLRSRPV